MSNYDIGGIRTSGMPIHLLYRVQTTASARGARASSVLITVPSYVSQNVPLLISLALDIERRGGKRDLDGAGMGASVTVA
jgi:hypothetical protein